VIFPDKPVHLISESHHHISKHPVIHVKASLPHDLPGIDPQLISLLDVIVKQCRTQVVCRCDRMKVPCEMKV
jgi:hypothetical protein